MCGGKRDDPAGAWSFPIPQLAFGSKPTLSKSTIKLVTSQANLLPCWWRKTKARAWLFPCLEFCVPTDGVGANWFWAIRRILKGQSKPTVVPRQPRHFTGCLRQLGTRPVRRPPDGRLCCGALSVSMQPALSGADRFPFCATFKAVGLVQGFLCVVQCGDSRHIMGT